MVAEINFKNGKEKHRDHQHRKALQRNKAHHRRRKK